MKCLLRTAHYFLRERHIEQNARCVSTLSPSTHPGPAAGRAPAQSRPQPPDDPTAAISTVEFRGKSL